jgi:Na+/H+ antiporter NhaD/arsenite permease-like protein
MPRRGASVIEIKIVAATDGFAWLHCRLPECLLATRSMPRYSLSRAFAVVLLAGMQSSAHAAAGDHVLDGAEMRWFWAVPFAGILLSIAAGPLLFPKLWHAHYGKFSAVWAMLTLVPLALVHGSLTAAGAFVHAILGEYISFILLLFALYTVAGSILVTGSFGGTPLSNAMLLALGTLIASFVGTTGAAMILIRPLIRANAWRTQNAHVIVFFIILVANVGGALTPLGDPPLFVGFLHGVSFFWTMQNLWMQTAIVAVILLAMFFAVDAWLSWRVSQATDKNDGAPIRVHGKVNFVLIALIIVAILASAAWRPGIAFDILGTEVELRNLVRDFALVLIALASLKITPDEHRQINGFTWAPIREVAILFAGIFTAIIPVLAMLQAGKNGAFAWLLTAVTAEDGSPHEAAYFWLTGILSAFLDNAPTYLVFFQLAGGDASQLMGPLGGTLASISLGAVYMGALTYIGNAPNFMVYAIAREQGVRMPNFFGYLLWAGLILVPLFVLLTLLPIPPLLKIALL